MPFGLSVPLNQTFIYSMASVRRGSGALHLLLALALCLSGAIVGMDTSWKVPWTPNSDPSDVSGLSAQIVHQGPTS